MKLWRVDIPSTYPRDDAELAAIVGPQPYPNEESLWCEECVRWESGPWPHPSPETCWRAARLEQLAGWLLQIVWRLRRRAVLVQAAHLVKTGQGHSDRHYEIKSKRSA